MNTSLHIKSILIWLAAMFGMHPILNAQIEKHKIIIYTDTTLVSEQYWNKNSTELKNWVKAIETGFNNKGEFELPPLGGIQDLFNIQIEARKNNDSTIIQIGLAEKKNKKINNEDLVVMEIDEEVIDDQAPANPEKNKTEETYEITIEDGESTVRKVDQNTETTYSAWVDKNGKVRTQKEVIYKNTGKDFKPELFIGQAHLGLGYLLLQPLLQPTTLPTSGNYMPELNNSKSIHFYIDYLKGLNLIKGKIRLWIGVTYDISNYRFRNNNVRLTPNTDEFNFILQDPSVEQADKSKLVTNYLGIPVLLGFQNHAQNPTFKISVGAQAGYLVRSHTKYRTENGNKTKKFDDFNMSDIAVHPVFNLTWESFTFYAKYALTNLFKKDQGLDQKNMMFGLALNIN